MTEQPLDPNEYLFWLPPERMTLTTGPDNEEVEVPQLPLPIHGKDLEGSNAPSEKAIGEGLYDYLQQFPDCPSASEYAMLLKAAYPFYVADLGSQLIMFDAKKAIDTPGLRRKINMMKVLALLEPENFGLLQKIGMSYFDLALTYSELVHVRRELGSARQWLEKARRLKPEESGNLNYLAQVCYYSAKYPQAKLYWRIITDKMDDSAAKTELLARIARIEAEQLPEQPLIDSLESVGAAMEHFQIGEYQEACAIMEELTAQGDLPKELPNPEFYLLLGLCREKIADSTAAVAAFKCALDLDPDHSAAKDGLSRLESAQGGLS